MERLSLSNLGQTLAKQEPELAISFYKQAVNVVESIRQDSRNLPRESQELYTASVAFTYRNLADLLLTQGRTREAQEILELLKVQEASDYNPSKIQNPKSKIQLKLHPLEQQAIETFDKAIAQNQSLKLQDYETLNQPLKQNRDRLIQDGNAKETAIGNPQNLIADPNTILIQNLVINDKLWVIWTTKSGGTQAIVTPLPKAKLDETVKTFRKQIGTQNSDLKELQTTSQTLHNWLIPPALQTELTKTPKQHLIFSLDHVTRYIPIAALHNGTQYLTQRYQLSNITTTDTDTHDRLTTPQTTPPSPSAPPKPTQGLTP